MGIERAFREVAEAAFEEVVVVEYFVLDLVDEILVGFDGFSLAVQTVD